VRYQEIDKREERMGQKGREREQSGGELKSHHRKGKEVR
jgi:hypothetical protein